MADTPQNIEHFNRVVLKLLDLLYETFPHPQPITPKEAKAIGFEAVPEDASYDESWTTITMVPDIIEWLGEEGFIRYEADPNHIQRHFYKVRLTMKGLAILGYIPSSLGQAEPKESIIQQAKRALNAGATVAGKEAVKQVVAQIFKFALD